MRMRNVNPKILCYIHLNQEHGEIHKHRHIFVKKYSIKGRIETVDRQPQIEPKSMKSRHDDIEQEARRRGYNFNSPYTMPDLSYLPEHHREATIDPSYSLLQLLNECEKCRKRYNKYYGGMI